jgi:hypothetical protein
MRLRRTLRRSRGDHPVFDWAFRYALAAVGVGAGMLLIGPSPGVGWALIVFGGWLATLTSGPRPGLEVRQTPARPGRPLVRRVDAGPTAESDRRADDGARAQPAAFARSAPDRASGSRGALGVLASWHFGPGGDLPPDRLRAHRRPPAARLYRRQPEAPQLFLASDTDPANHPARCQLRRGSALMAGPTRPLDGTRPRAGGGGRPVRPRAWRAVR